MLPDELANPGQVHVTLRFRGTCDCDRLRVDEQADRRLNQCITVVQASHHSARREGGDKLSQQTIRICLGPNVAMDGLP